MNKITKFKSFILYGLLFVLITTIGCDILQSNQNTIDNKSYKVSGISRQDYQKIKNLIKYQTVSVEPNTVGFITVSGNIENGSIKTIKKVRVVIFSQGTQGPKKLVLGDEVVTDIKPGETKTFNITTSDKSSDVSDFEVKLGDISF